MTTLQEVLQVFRRQAGALQDGAQRSWFHRAGAVDGDDHSARQVGGVPHDDMGSLLSFDDEPGFLKGTNQAGTRNLGKNAQEGTSTSLKIAESSGMARPSSCSVERYNTMASRMFDNA